MSALTLYLKFIRMNFLSGIQYKGWPIMVIQVFLVVITDPISLIFTFSRFGSIGSWSVERILLIYSIAVTSFGLAETFCRGFDYFPWKMIRTGDFDRVLLRPQPLIVQIAGSYFHIHRLARVFSGIFAISWCLNAMDIKLGLSGFLLLISALAGGFLTYTGVFLFTSGIAFFTIKALDWIYILTNASYQVVRCPIDYMPVTLRYLFTFFMPMLVISYYPASVICGWGESFYKGLLALPAGFTFLMFSLLVWRFGVKHYKSTGS
jgi:ABC-2 type transport system permease protein